MEQPKVNVYENSPNNSDALQADVYDPSTQSTTYFYGSFNNNGAPLRIKSIVLSINKSDTVCHYILDEQKRISIVFSSLKNGTKLSAVVKMLYPNDSTAIVNFYEHNWLTNTDIFRLQFYYNYKDKNIIKTYGRTMLQSEADEFTNEITSVKNSTLTFKKIIGAAIGISAVVCLVNLAACPVAVGFIVGSAILLSGSISHGAELNPSQNVNAPTSPSSSPYPNPRIYSYSGRFSGGGTFNLQIGGSVIAGSAYEPGPPSLTYGIQGNISGYSISAHSSLPLSDGSTCLISGTTISGSLSADSSSISGSYSNCWGTGTWYGTRH